MNNDLIIIKQLPIIEAKVREISQAVAEKVETAESLVVTLDSKQTAKTIRATLNKEFDELETMRKAVKNAIMEPYNNFEKLYKEEIRTRYKGADATLKAKIAEIEDAEKAQTTELIKDYFDELVQTIPSAVTRKILKFENAGIKVNLSSSLPQLEKQCAEYVYRVADDVKTILGMNYSEELYHEYANHFDLARAIRTVNQKHKAMEETARMRQKEEQEQQAAEEHDRKVTEGITMPVEVPPPPAPEDVKQYTLTFKVTATKAELIKLKQFLINGGYKYE